jgi:Uma2 family endonuclease
MVSLLERPPRTTMEVFKMLPEGTRCELIEGIIYMSPAPTIDHQSVIVTLTGSLFNFAKKTKSGKVFTGPIDVYFDSERDAFQPDLIFITNSRSSIIKEDGIYGAPDLVVEILSPGTKNFDLTKKKKIYEKSGVKEYWVVDPTTRIAICFKLIEKKFIEFKKEKGKIVSSLLNRTFKF